MKDKKKVRSKKSNDIKKLSVILISIMIMIVALITAYRNIVITSQDSVQSFIKIMLEILILACSCAAMITALVIVLTVITGDGDTTVKVLEREISLSEVMRDNRKERVSVIVDKNGKPIKYSE